MNPVLATYLGILVGALCTLIGLWTQSKWRRREATLKHEQMLFQKRLEIATRTVAICYEYFTASHRYATSREEKDRALFGGRRAQLTLSIFEVEPEIDLLFPETTVKAFRGFLNSVDSIVRSDTHWTAIGSRLDSEFSTFVSKVRADIGIKAAEVKLSQSLARTIRVNSDAG